MLKGSLAIVSLLLVAFVFSEDRRRIRPRIVLTALACQFGIALTAFYAPFGRAALQAMSTVVTRVIAFADAGSQQLFGDLATDRYGFILAFRVLPIIIFVSSLMSVLYYARVMQWVVFVMGGAIQKVIGTGRVISMCAAANVFVGHTEAPLVIQPYLRSLSRAQLFTVMASGLASISGAILAGYASLGIRLDYLIAAAFMAAPGGLLMASILVPDTEDGVDDSEILGAEIYDDQSSRPANVVEAAADGATIGVKLAANIGGMLIAFIALIALVNGIVGAVGGLFGFDSLSLETILGGALSPLMYLLGIPWSEAAATGNLIGQKLILNEFIAFIQLVQIQDQLSSFSVAVTTFALCGFANLNSLAILLGGLAGLVPERKSDIAKLGFKAVLAGSLSNLMSAAIASLLIS